MALLTDNNCFHKKRGLAPNSGAGVAFLVNIKELF